MRVGSRQNSSVGTLSNWSPQRVSGSKKSTPPLVRYVFGTIPSAPATPKHFEMMGCVATAMAFITSL